MFKYYLDNTLVNDPSNWKDFEEVLEYDIEANSFLFSYPLALEFSGAAYDYLVSQSDTDNCNYVEIKIEQNICGQFKVVFLGNIFLSDITINRTRCIVKAPVQDNGFISFLNNNKNIKVQIYELPYGSVPHTPQFGFGATKNDVSFGSTLNIDPRHVDLFNVATGSYNGYYATFGYTLYDCFKFLIGYLSDLKMDFESNFLDTSLPIVYPKDNIKRLILTDGANIYWGARNTFFGSTPITSLNDLLKEVNRFYSIGYYVRYDFNGRATFVLEDLDYFLNSNVSTSYITIKDVEEKRATNVYYSIIKTGGQYAKFEEDSTNYKFEEEPLYTFGEENYYFAGNCNIDKTLDLGGQFIVDTNIIQSLSFFPSSLEDANYATYKDNLFFIETDITGLPNNETAYRTLNANNADYHYNENLINSRIMARLDNLGDIYSQPQLTQINLINTSPKKYLKNYSFSKSIPDSEYETIKENITEKININVDNNNTIVGGWIKKISRKFATGESVLELRAE